MSDLAMPAVNVWLSARQVARRLGCTRQNVQYLIQQGHIAAMRTDRELLIREGDLTAYQASRAEGPQQESGAADA